VYPERPGSGFTNTFDGSKLQFAMSDNIQTPWITFKKRLPTENRLLSRIVFTYTYRGHEIKSATWELAYESSIVPHQFEIVHMWKQYEEEDIENSLRYLLLSSFFLSLGILTYSLLNASVRTYGPKVDSRQ